MKPATAFLGATIRTCSLRRCRASVGTLVMTAIGDKLFYFDEKLVTNGQFLQSKFGEKLAFRP